MLPVTSHQFLFIPYLFLKYFIFQLPYKMSQPYYVTFRLEFVNGMYGDVKYASNLRNNCLIVI